MPACHLTPGPIDGGGHWAHDPRGRRAAGSDSLFPIPPTTNRPRSEPMTEAEWVDRPTSKAALKHLHRPPGDRKLRLFLCHCCRGVWHLLGKRCRAAVEVAQRFADGMASEEELAGARVAAKEDQKCYGVYFAYAARPTFADAAAAAETIA